MNQILELATLDETFDVPDTFDLREYWAAGIAEFRAQRIQGSALVRVSPSGLQMLRDSASGPVVEAFDGAGDDAVDGWRTVEVPIESIDHAHNQFLGLGTAVEVLEPPRVARAPRYDRRWTRRSLRLRSRGCHRDRLGDGHGRDDLGRTKAWMWWIRPLSSSRIE